jgi:hypothetical protein
MSRIVPWIAIFLWLLQSTVASAQTNIPERMAYNVCKRFPHLCRPGPDVAERELNIDVCAVWPEACNTVDVEGLEPVRSLDYCAVLPGGCVPSLEEATEPELKIIEILRTSEGW